MGARYDKYEPVGGGFRGVLAADLTFSAAGEFGPKAVSLDANGKVVVGTAGQSGGVGVLVKNVPMTPPMGSIAGIVATGIPLGGRAGEAVDVMTDGEIVDVTGLVAGTTYFAAADGSLTATPLGAGINGYRVGHTMELQSNGLCRLVVRFERVQG